MDSPGDIPAPEGGHHGLVWLVNGTELPFVEQAEPHRPWLEESAGWVSSGAPGPDVDVSCEMAETLLWL